MTQYLTEDLQPITVGAVLFNYYDGQWGTVVSDPADDAEGWFDLAQENGRRAYLNGARVSTYDPNGTTPAPIHPGYPAPTTQEGQDEQDRLANEAADAFFDTLRAENTPAPVKQNTPTVRITPGSRLFGMAGSHVVTIDRTYDHSHPSPVGIHFYSDRMRTTLCVTRRPVDALFGNWERDERAIRI